MPHSASIACTTNAARRRRCRWTPPPPPPFPPVIAAARGRSSVSSCTSRWPRRTRSLVERRKEEGGSCTLLGIINGDCLVGCTSVHRVVPRTRAFRTSVWGFWRQDGTDFKGFPTGRRRRERERSGTPTVASFLSLGSLPSSFSSQARQSSVKKWPRRYECADERKDDMLVMDSWSTS